MKSLEKHLKRQEQIKKHRKELFKKIKQNQLRSLKSIEYAKHFYSD